MSLIAGALGGLGKGISEAGLMLQRDYFDREKESRLEAIKEKWYSKEREDKLADRESDRAYQAEQKIQDRADRMTDWAAQQNVAMAREDRKMEFDAEQNRLNRAATAANYGRMYGGKNVEKVTGEDGSVYMVDKESGNATPVMIGGKSTKSMGIIASQQNAEFGEFGNEATQGMREVGEPQQQLKAKDTTSVYSDAARMRQETAAKAQDDRAFNAQVAIVNDMNSTPEMKASARAFIASYYARNGMVDMPITQADGGVMPWVNPNKQTNATVGANPLGLNLPPK